VIRSRVLPGFQFRLDDLCRRPEHDSLRDDPIYAAFVLPGWREAERRAAAAALTAEAEAQRADAETRRADTQAQRAEAESARAAAEEQARQQAEQRATAQTLRADAAELARRQAEERAQEAEQALARLQARLADRPAER
jgi:hypothetical protein